MIGKVKRIEELTQELVSKYTRDFECEIGCNQLGMVIIIKDPWTLEREEETWMYEFVNELELEYLDLYISNILSKLIDKVKLAENW